jgi:predicted TIM-barrel fold metal-dependent hydrolase
LVHATIADRPDWRRQRVSFALDEPTDLLAARITLQYDPRQLRIHAAESSDEAAGRVLLNRVDEERGVLDIQTAWLAEGALLDTLASIQIENLRDFDAEIRLSFDIRDRFNTSRRGQDVFRLRFEPPPASTALLQNYPNPFNPETWIPFELSEDAEVTVRIYSVEGALVRTLHLGERALGRYRDRDRAAYWDGANESGEPVASGVYLYELRAGAHRETRRMAIRK